MLGDLNERAISLEEVGEAVNEMKSGKAPGLDGFLVGCLNKGGMAVLEWIVRLVNLSFYMGVIPMDWHGACITMLLRFSLRVTEEICGFRQGRGCMDDVFAVMQDCEKYFANGKEVFWVLMDLEKAFDTID